MTVDNAGTKLDLNLDTVMYSDEVRGFNYARVEIELTERPLAA